METNKIDLDLLQAWELFQRKGWTKGNVSLAEALIIARLGREHKTELAKTIKSQIKILKTMSNKEVKKMIKERKNQLI